MSIDYWLGVATLPTIVAVAHLALRSASALEAALRARGWTMEVKANRDPQGVSDYTCRRDIWFEQQRGPIFTGHWYRVDAHHNGKPFVTRWLGIGSADGRSVMFYRKRVVEQ